MTDRTVGTSPSRKARIAGVFYLLTFLTGGYALFVGGRWRFVATLIASACYVVVTLLFYYIFKPVSKSLSFLAALFSLTGCFLGAIGSPIDPTVFFGCYCLLIGYLIVKSLFLPSVLGVLMAFAGLGWLTFVSPQLAKFLIPYNLIPGLLGEGALTLWLLVVSLNEPRWKEQALARGVPASNDLHSPGL